jgi:hypothetical protein
LRRKARAERGGDALFATSRRERTPPFAFVLAELEGIYTHTRPMFGCTAVYVDELIVLILRDKAAPRRDNGVWIATTREHHESLREELVSMRPISLFGPRGSAWQNLPSDALSFEDDALRACALIRARDPRIGKTPARKRPGPRPTSREVARTRPGRRRGAGTAR